MTGSPNPVARDAFDETVARLDSPMIVLTASARGEPTGCLVGFHSQCGIQPLRYAVWLSKANHTYRVAHSAERFGVHFLGDDDHDLAAHFGELTGDVVDKFAGLDWQPGPFGVPRLMHCPNWFIGERVLLIDTDCDHACLVLQPTDTGGVPFAPLRFSAVSDVDPGHPA